MWCSTVEPNRKTPDKSVKGQLIFFKLSQELWYKSQFDLALLCAVVNIPVDIYRAPGSSSTNNGNEFFFFYFGDLNLALSHLILVNLMTMGLNLSNNNGVKNYL